MILMIIFGAAVVIGGIMAIVGYTLSSKFYYDTEPLGGIGAGICGFGIVLGLIFGTICLVVNSRATYIRTYSELENTVEYLNDTKNALDAAYETGSDSVYLTVSITDYNEKVATYKTTIISEQYQLSNKWINWLTSSAYGEFSADDVEYFRGN